jgi:hypothetical protein
MPIEKVTLTDKFALIDDHWHPRIAGEVDAYALKIAKIKGEFIATAKSSSTLGNLS